MSDTHAPKIPSLVKKYLMAATGMVLVAFVLGHMLGNLQMFAGSPDKINRYANFLQSLGELLYAIRLFLLACVVVHVWMAILLTMENRRARPEHYQKDATVQASYASRTMIWSGLIVGFFIIFHLAHFTLQMVHPIFESLEYEHNGQRMHDVYAMVIAGFSEPVVVGFYIVAVGMLCAHLSHGVSSMFQSLGLRNEKWRGWLNGFAVFYGWAIFLGFASVPVAVQLSLHAGPQLVQGRLVLDQINDAQKAWNPAAPTPVMVNYNAASADASPVKTAKNP